MGYTFKFRCGRIALIPWHALRFGKVPGACTSSEVVGWAPCGVGIRASTEWRRGHRMHHNPASARFRRASYSQGAFSRPLVVFSCHLESEHRIIHLFERRALHVRRECLVSGNPVSAEIGAPHGPQAAPQGVAVAGVSRVTPATFFVQQPSDYARNSQKESCGLKKVLDIT